MKAPQSECLTVAAALVGTLAVSSTVSGTALADTMIEQAAPPALAIASAALAPHLHPAPAPPPAPDAAAPSTDVRVLLSEPTPGCAEPCVALKKGPLTDDILRELQELPLIDTVMAPVTRGVTIETGEGAPTLTLAVKPTKITRGSGLVAIGKF